jgi:hypothetical protein
MVYLDLMDSLILLPHIPYFPGTGIEGRGLKSNFQHTPRKNQKKSPTPLSSPFFHIYHYTMAFAIGGGGADCSAGANPMSQMLKQFNQDRSLQRVSIKKKGGPLVLLYTHVR